MELDRVAQYHAVRALHAFLLSETTSGTNVMRPLPMASVCAYKDSGIARVQCLAFFFKKKVFFFLFRQMVLKTSQVQKKAFAQQ